MTHKAIQKAWPRFWMLFAGRSFAGQLATRLAALLSPPYYKRTRLAWMNPKGYLSPKATIHHGDLLLGPNVYIDDDVLIYQDKDGGPVEVGQGVHLHRGTIIQTGHNGSVIIGAGTHIQPRCQFSAYMAGIRIGSDVEIAPYCAFYPYDHGIAKSESIRQQSLQTKGPIVIEDGAWLGVRATVLSGVRIGKGAVVGAGAVVNQDVPDGAIAAGVPARVIKMRDE